MKNMGKALNHSGIIFVGGWSLILAALLYPIISMNMNLPESFKGGEESLLSLFQTFDDSERFFLFLMSFVPFLIVFGAVGLFEALRSKGVAMMGVALGFAVVAAFSISLGIFRWSAMVWDLSGYYAEVTLETQETLAFFHAYLDILFGTLVGGFLGQGALYIFILLTSFAIKKSNRMQNWMAYIGFATVLVGGLGLFTPFMPALSFFGSLMSIVPLVPIWFLTVGVALVRFRKPLPDYEENISDDIANPSKKVKKTRKKKSKGRG